MPAHIPHWLDVTLAVLATACAAVEAWRIRRGAGSGWWFMAYVAFGVAFATYATRGP